MKNLFARFLEEKKYLNNASPATIRLYSHAWAAFKRHAGCVCHVSADTAKLFVLNAAREGIQPSSVNSYARAVNSFLAWLFDAGHISARVRVPFQPTAKRVLKTYTDEEASRIISHKPRSRGGKRMLALIYLLIDTGARVSEALKLKRADIDWDNWLVTLEGKGKKQRRVPICPECRKRLFQWLQTHNHELVFCTRGGGKLRYDSMRRDFLKLLKAAKVEKSEGSFHAFRRFCAKAYLKKGGNVLYLQKLLGHASLQMTQRYVEADAEDLQRAHLSLSPLEGLKKR